MRTHRLTVADLAVLGVFVLGAASAQAKTGYVDVCPSLASAFCTSGTIPGAKGVAVDNSSAASAGTVWMAQGGELKVLKFDATGNELAGEISNSNLPGSATPFSGYLGYLAVDPGDGSLYVEDLTGSGKGTVTKFSFAGVFQFQLAGGTCIGTCPPNPSTESKTPQGTFEPWGVAVDPSTHDLYVADSRSAHIDKFSSSGAYISQFEATRAYQYNGLAVDPSGNVYVANVDLSGGNNAVRVYSSSGTPLNCPGANNILYENPPGVGNYETPVVVDPANGTVLVGENPASGEPVIGAYSAPCVAAFFRFGTGQLGTYVGQMGVRGSTHRVYVPTPSNQDGVIFDQIQLPDVTTGTPATNVTRTSATLSGTINPNNVEVTGCRFDYGTTTAYGKSVACSQMMPLAGSTTRTVSAQVNGIQLPPSTVVHYRLDETDAVDTSFRQDTGEDETFTTEPLPPPVVSDLPATQVSQFDARLHATINPGGGVASYHFVYGTTAAYGSVAPVPDSYTPMTSETVAVSQSVGGLQANTTYHFALVASSPGGTNVVGLDEAFTTPPIPTPNVSAGGTGGITQSAAMVFGTVDPHGWDTTYFFQYGITTGYGANWPTVPVDMGALEGAQPVAVELQNLLPGIVYHVRLVASNGGGTTYGPDMTFTTAEYPASVIQTAPVLTASSLGFFDPEAAMGRSLTREQKLVRALKRCKKRPKKQRAGCERSARKKHRAS